MKVWQCPLAAPMIFHGRVPGAMRVRGLRFFPAAVAPDAPEKLGTAAKGGDKNKADAKKNAKEKSAISRASARVGPHRYYNYYPGSHSGWYRRW